VTVNGTDVPVKAWKADKLACTLPAADQPGGAGPVVVKVRGIKSNVVPITLWRGRVEYEYHSTGDTKKADYKQTMDFNMVLRGDVHAHRNAPGAEPVGRAALLQSARGSRGVYPCSGSEYVGLDVPYTNMTHSWLGKGTLEPLFTRVENNRYSENGDPKAIAVVSGEIDAGTRKGKLCLSFGAKDGWKIRRKGMLCINDRGDLEPFDVTDAHDFPIGIDESAGDMKAFCTLDAEFHDDWGGNGGRRSGSGDNCTFEIRWSPLTAEFAPEPEAQDYGA
jgi:hypothetical protein